LIVPYRGYLEYWVGLGKIKEQNNLSAEIAVQTHPLLIDIDGNVILSLWPMIQVDEPINDGKAELFFLAGKGRNGAKFLALPNNLEKMIPIFGIGLAKIFMIFNPQQT